MVVWERNVFATADVDDSVMFSLGKMRTNEGPMRVRIYQGFRPVSFYVFFALGLLKF